MHRVADMLCCHWLGTTASITEDEYLLHWNPEYDSRVLVPAADMAAVFHGQLRQLQLQKAHQPSD